MRARAVQSVLLSRPCSSLSSRSRGTRTSLASAGSLAPNFIPRLHIEKGSLVFSFLALHAVIQRLLSCRAVS